MQFVNMTNIFSIFGEFVVFDEDTLSIVNKVYDGCNISINQEPTNNGNKSGKVLKIVDNKNRVTLTLRPNRIDVQTANFPKELKNQELKKVQDIFNTFAEMFEGSFATRLAYVSNDFVFDDDNKVMDALNERIHLFSDNKLSEIHLRVNSPMNILDEGMNVVTNIDNVMITANPQNQKRKSIIVVNDINTLITNTDDRFDLRKLEEYYSAMYDVSRDKIEDLSLIM